MTDPLDDLARLTQLAEAAKVACESWRKEAEAGNYEPLYALEQRARQSLNEYRAATPPDVLLHLVARLRRVEQAATALCDVIENDDEMPWTWDELEVLRAALAPAPPTPEGEKP